MGKYKRLINSTGCDILDKEGVSGTAERPDLCLECKREEQDCPLYRHEKERIKNERE